MKSFAGLAGLALLCTLSVGASPALAQEWDEWEEQVIALTAVTAVALEEEGFELSDVIVGSLDEGDVGEVSITLSGGAEHAIVGVCDEDCSDFDIAILDSYGEELDRDVLSDDLPVVVVSPEEDETFTVLFGMAACSAEPCRYGLAAYVR